MTTTDTEGARLVAEANFARALNLLAAAADELGTREGRVSSAHRVHPGRVLPDNVDSYALGRMLAAADYVAETRAALEALT